jgi:hypothetical protein
LLVLFGGGTRDGSAPWNPIDILGAGNSGPFFYPTHPSFNERVIMIFQALAWLLHGWFVSMLIISRLFFYLKRFEPAVCVRRSKSQWPGHIIKLCAHRIHGVLYTTGNVERQLPLISYFHRGDIIKPRKTKWISTHALCPPCYSKNNNKIAQTLVTWKSGCRAIFLSSLIFFLSI